MKGTKLDQKTLSLVNPARKNIPGRSFSISGTLKGHLEQPGKFFKETVSKMSPLAVVDRQGVIPEEITRCIGVHSASKLVASLDASDESCGAVDPRIVSIDPLSSTLHQKVKNICLQSGGTPIEDTFEPDMLYISFDRNRTASVALFRMHMELHSFAQPIAPFLLCVERVGETFRTVVRGAEYFEQAKYWDIYIADPFSFELDIKEEAVLVVDTQAVI